MLSTFIIAAALAALVILPIIFFWYEPKIVYLKSEINSLQYDLKTAYRHELRHGIYKKFPNLKPLVFGPMFCSEYSQSLYTDPEIARWRSELETKLRHKEIAAIAEKFEIESPKIQEEFSVENGIWTTKPAFRINRLSPEQANSMFAKEMKIYIDTPNYKIIIPKETGKTAADIANLVGNYGQTEN